MYHSKHIGLITIFLRKLQLIETTEHFSMFLREDNSAKILINKTDNNNYNDALSRSSVMTLTFCCSEALCNFLQNVNIPLLMILCILKDWGAHVFLVSG
jgi:hypothetical protein